MLKNLLHLTIISFFLIFSSLVISGDYITPEEARNHIGESLTVCGTVASTYYSYRSKGRPTFINLNKPYPNQIFTALIWSSDRSKFQGSPETMFKDKDICVSGRISEYNGTPQIAVSNPSQILVK